jgi:hypothetical protein
MLGLRLRDFAAVRRGWYPDGDYEIGIRTCPQKRLFAKSARNEAEDDGSSRDLSLSKQML